MKPMPRGKTPILLASQRRIGALALLLASTALGAAPPVVPRFDHIMIVVMENHAFAPIIGNARAPYINALAGQGAVFRQSFAVTHPSQPNYIALFSGSTQGVADDSCPNSFPIQPNLGAQLIAAKLSFAGYSEGLPSIGFEGCRAGKYRRKHNPWVDFGTVPTASNLPFSAFPDDLSTLPTVSFVVPDLCNDMHDCSIETGDTWLRIHIDRYAQWAKTHNSLLILTFDEDDFSADNRIPTIFVGARVIIGPYDDRIDHYRVLATIETAYGLELLGHAAGLAPISKPWVVDPTPLIPPVVPAGGQ